MGSGSGSGSIEQHVSRTYKYSIQNVSHLLKAIAQKAPISDLVRHYALNHESNEVLTNSRSKFTQRIPIKCLEVYKEEIYITTINRGQTILFDQRYPCQDLQGIQPESLQIDSEIFGSNTRRLMKQKARQKYSDDFKEKVLFIQRQCGIDMNTSGEVKPNSEIPSWIREIKFGAKCIPKNLIKNFFTQWESKSLRLFEMSIEEKSTDWNSLLQEVLPGLAWQTVWKPREHQYSIFHYMNIEEYLNQMEEKYDIHDTEEPATIHIAISPNKKKIVVISISNYCISMDFCEYNHRYAEVLLREAFSTITKIDDYDMIDQVV